MLDKVFLYLLAWTVLGMFFAGSFVLLGGIFVTLTSGPAAAGFWTVGGVLSVTAAVVIAKLIGDSLP